MGSPAASSGSSDAPMTTKSTLKKKNQDLVDSSFKDRGATKIKNSKFKTPATMILTKPLQHGSKVTRNFFTDKVLGSKNFKGTSKADFLDMSISQQESIYGDYIGNRQSGATDAYGNTISQGGNDNNGNQVVQAPTVIAPTTAEVSQATATDTTEDTIETRKKKAKATGRSVTILNRAKGISSDEGLTLGKRSLLGS